MDLRVQIAHPHAVFGQVVGEVLGHPLGEGGDQHPLLLVGPHADLAQQVIHLAIRGTHLHDRIKHPGGANHLFGHLALALGHLPVAGGGAHEDGLLRLLPEFITLERPVVGGAGQAEAVLDQHLLAALVAVVHGLQLGAGDMALIHHQQPVVGEVIDQAFRRRAGGATGQVAGVILNAVAVAHLLQHLQVVGGALFQPLGLQQPPLQIEQIQPFAELGADLLDRPLQPLLRGHEVLGGIDVDGVHALQNLTAGGIHIANCLHLIAKQFDPHQPIFIGGPDLEHIAPHPEAAAGNLDVIAGILVVHQLPQRSTQVERFAHLELHGGLEVFGGNTEAIDAADRGHHDHILALEQRAGGGVTQHVDLLVDRRRLGDVSIRDRHVGLGLVVVVIGDEVFHRIVREELPQLIAELGRQGLVVGQHQGGPPGLGDHIGDRKGLAGAGGPQQGLIALTAINPGGEGRNRRGLVTLRLVGGVELERNHHPIVPESAVQRGVGPAGKPSLWP